MTDELIDRLIAATQPLDMFERLAEATMSSYRELVPMTIEVQDMFSEEYTLAMEAAYPLVRSAVELQVDELQEGDLEKIVRFFESPAGQRWMTSLDNAEDRLQEMGETFMQRIADRLEERISLYRARKRKQS